MHRLFTTSIVVMGLAIGAFSFPTNGKAQNNESVDELLNKLALRNPKQEVPSALRSYAIEVTVTYPDAEGNPLWSAKIYVVPVDKNIAIHFFSTDNYMFLNHVRDEDDRAYYQAALFPLLKMKAYVVSEEFTGRIAPTHMLSRDTQELLELQRREIAQYGDVENYTAMVQKNGYLAPKKRQF